MYPARDSSAQGPAPLERAPLGLLEGRVPSYVAPGEANLDPATVTAFGDEWDRFSDFSDDDVERGGREYFADLIADRLLDGARVLDAGCGSGRWTKYLARRAAFVDAADPSRAALVAARATLDCPNVRVIQAGISSLPYRAGSFDLVASVGVLHHVPDTAAAIDRLAALVRPDGHLYLYLYYRLDGRPFVYRLAFFLAQGLRGAVSRLPRPVKLVACDVAAVAIYLPLVLLARLLRSLAPGRTFYEHVPLHYYMDKPWKIIRNDALDRLGTPLERRFSRAEITGMLERAGLRDVRFAEAMPRWRVVARQPRREAR